MNDRSSELSLKYLSGFGSHHESEALPGALPVGRNSPQKTPFGLYAEQLSGSSFTMPRAQNLRSWLYRLRPSAMHKPYARIADGLVRTAPSHEAECSPNRMRWAPLEVPAEPVDFLDGLHTLATCGDSRLLQGCGAHVYVANRSMEERRFCFDRQNGRLAVNLGIAEPIAIGAVDVAARGELDQHEPERRRVAQRRRRCPHAMPRLIG